MHSKNRILFVVTVTLSLLIFLTVSEAATPKTTPTPKAPATPKPTPAPKAPATPKPTPAPKAAATPKSTPAPKDAQACVSPRHCFTSQYHTPDQWQLAEQCRPGTDQICRQVPISQSVYEDLFSTHCGGFCKKSAYRANMCQATSPNSVKIGAVNACCPNGDLAFSKKCLKKSAADIAAETTRVGCASMYGPDYDYWKQCKAENLYSLIDPYTHSNFDGVPKTWRAGMRIAVNSLTPDWKPASSSFKVKTTTCNQNSEICPIVHQTSDCSRAGVRQRLLVWRGQRLTEL